MTISRILVIDDEEDIRRLIEEILSDEGYMVRTAGNAHEARQQVREQRPDLILLDIWMPDTDGITLLKEWSAAGEPDCPVVIMSGHGTVETAVEATRLGAADFIEKPLSIAKLLRTITIVLEKHRESAKSGGRSLLPSMIAPVGKSRQMAVLREATRRAAGGNAPVLVVGESGTGRQAIARYLHSISERKERPFVVLPSAALTEDGAATVMLGAKTDIGFDAGLFDQANGGVLFVDELQDLCQEAQRLLLGVIDQSGFSRPGEVQPAPANIRFVASTRAEAIASPSNHNIRSDLLSRLSGERLLVPPLREYSEDVPELLSYFVDQLVDANDLSFRRFSVAAQNRLRNYPWPGNIRELENLTHRLLSAGGPDEIILEELEKYLSAPEIAGSSLVQKDLLSLPLREAREHFERAYLTEQLALCGGKVGQLAKRVGMERTHLYRKLRTLGVTYRQ